MDMFSDDLIRCFISKLKKHAKEMIDVLWSVLHALGTQLRARKRKELLQSAIHGQDLGAKDKSRVIYGPPGTQSRRIRTPQPAPPWLTSSAAPWQGVSRSP